MNVREQDIWQSKEYSRSNRNLVHMVPVGVRSEMSLESWHKPRAGGP